MQSPVPEEAREAAEKMVRALEEQLAPLFERLPEAPESAIQFRLAVEEDA